MSYANEWGTVYNKSILAFTGRNKVAVRELENVVKGTSELVAALALLDQHEFATVRDEKEREKAHKAFGVALKKKFEPAKKKYMAVLDTAIDKTDKDLHPEAYREVKTMSAHLDWMAKKLVNDWTQATKALKAADAKAGKRVEKETNMAREQKLDDNQVKREVDYAKQLRSLVSFPTAIKQASARALVAIQAIKKEPTPAVYNNQIDKGGRNYTQQMSNLIKLSRDPKCPEKVVQLLAGLDAYATQLDAFGNGAKRSVPDTTSTQQIKVLITEYAKLFKDTLPYADKLAEHMKKHPLK